MITFNKTLAEIVSDNFKAAAVLSKYDLDFCCGGKTTIGSACTRKGLDARTVIDEIEKTQTAEYIMPDFAVMNAGELSEYIERKHHDYARSMFPLILTHAAKAAQAHGEKRPELKQINVLFRKIVEEMEIHMRKEEKMLFPYIKKLALTDITQFVQPFGSVKNPIHVMEHEHEIVGEAMAEIRKLTGNYKLPEDLCETCRVLFKELKEFEEDLHMHVHLENNILFPMAVKLEEMK